jgi:ribosomal protein L7/L12
MTKDELVGMLRKMTVDELIELGPFFKEISETSMVLGTSLKGNCFNINLIDIGPNKINAIKAVRESVLGIGLKEAKDLVESPLPVTVIHECNFEQAQMFKKKFTDLGATVEIEIC